MIRHMWIILLLTGCGFAGTGTGNPINHGSLTGNPDEMAPFPRIFYALCHKVSTCTGEEIDGCWGDLQSRTDFASKLGRTDNASVARMISDDENGEPLANPVATVSCRQGIEALACEGLTTSKPDMLGPECATVFQ